MPKYSQSSKEKLKECNFHLQKVFNEVIKYFDCTIVTGHRTKEEQEKKVKEGKSQVHWPNSKHNTKPSIAVDVAPYPIDWNDIKRFHYFAGFVKGIATSMGVELRWGGDWDNDTQVEDNHFDDLLHFELVNKHIEE